VNKASPPTGLISTGGMVYLKSVAKYLAVNPSDWDFREQLSEYFRKRRLKLDVEKATPLNCIPPLPGWKYF